jgi:hypothetical protein
MLDLGFALADQREIAAELATQRRKSFDPAQSAANASNRVCERL